jgi:hypothetical protein
MAGHAISFWHAHFIYGKNFEAVSNYFHFGKFASAFIFSPMSLSASPSWLAAPRFDGHLISPHPKYFKFDAFTQASQKIK